MYKELITTDKIIELGFIESKKYFTKSNLKLKKHPTMNWLIFSYKKDFKYLKTMKDVNEFMYSKFYMLNKC